MEYFELAVDLATLGLKALDAFCQEDFEYAGALTRRRLQTGQELTDRPASQTSCQQVLDHHHTLDHRLVEFAPPTRGPVRADQPLLLVVPQGARTDTGGVREFSDAHGPSLALHTSVKSDPDHVTPFMHWIYLAIAVLFEIAVALSAGKAQGFTPPAWTAATLLTGALGTYFLSRALLTFDVGVGYALWTSLAGVGITLLGALLFGQRLTWRKAIGIALVIGGVVGLQLTA